MGMKKSLLLQIIWSVLFVYPLLGDTATYQNTNNLDCVFEVSAGSNINEVVVKINTNDSSFTLGSSIEISHDGASGTAFLDSGDNVNYLWNLSTTVASPINGTVHLEAGLSSGIITITIWINPHINEGSYGQFPSTQNWSLTVPASSSHNWDVTTSAKDINGDDVVDNTGSPVGAVDIDIEEPSVTIPAPTGLFISNAGEYLTPSGGTVDFGLAPADWSNPIAGGETFEWDLDGSSSSPVAGVDSADPVVYNADNAAALPSPHTRYDISVTVRATANGCIATDSVVLYVKNLPQITGLSVVSPATTPPYGDGPLDVDLSATVVHGDPFTEGDGDNDLNSTDYRLSWDFGNGTVIPTGETLTAGSSYADTGIHNVTLTIEDDYGQTESLITEDIYVTPFDNINFPPMAALPGEPGFPVIDGILFPTDTDDDGLLEGNGNDVIEMGWHNAFRATFASGTDDPVAIQCFRPQNLTASPYLYLSIEVNNDSVFDADDVIVLTFRPDRATATAADDRRLFIFPVYNGAGAGNGSVANRHFDEEPRIIEYYGNSDSWSEITSDITEAATETDPGFYARVHSFEAGTDNYSWHVELRVPIDDAEGGDNWVDFTDEFLFYANVIRVSDRTDAFGTAGYGTQFRWPREAPWAAGSLTDAANFPSWQWGGARRDSSFGDSTGVYFNSWSDIGIWDGSNILNSINVDSDPFTVPMAARVHNNAADSIDNVQVLFRVANWGATLLQDGNWTEIPENSAASPSANPTDSFPVSGGSDDLTHLNWGLSSGDGFYEHFRDVQDHQCVYAEISAADGNIIRKSYWNNMNFQVSSTVEDTALISTIGIGKAPENREGHRIILEIVKQEWTEERRDDTKAMMAAEEEGFAGLTMSPGADKSFVRPANPSISDYRLKDIYGADAAEEAGTDSFLEYLVYASYDTGDSLRINGNEYTMFEPIASFGYVFYHEDEVRRWLDEIDGAEKISDTLYVINIDEEDEAIIGLEVESRESRGMSVGVHAGAAIPFNTLANAVGPGMSFFADFGWEVTSNISLNALLGYHYLFALNSGSADTYFINLSANVRYYLRKNRRFRVFLGAGPGLYFPENDIAFGFNAGLGVDFKLNRLLALEIGADYHYVQTSGGTSQFSTQQIGLKYRF